MANLLGEKKGAFSLDVNNMMSDMLGTQKGIRLGGIETLKGKILSAHEKILALRAKGEMGFTDLPYQGKTLDEVSGIAERIAGRWENFVLLGIGGSALGPISVHTALMPEFYNLLPPEKRGNMPRIFFVDNIDPDLVGGLLELLEGSLDKTIFNVVTKSGGTAETLANFLVFRDRIRQRLGDDRLSDRFIITTDPESGTLRQIALEEGYQILTIPKNVGGRFSVFTPVGLLPSAVTGIDISSMLAGARQMDGMCKNPDVWQNPAYLKGVLDYISDVSLGKKIQVMMPYSNRLKDVADWYRQLWAESLGKRLSLEGEEVWAGTTPVKALGVTDQHSQLQLYQEGPDDKVITFLAVEEEEKSVHIPKGFSDKEGIAYLGGHKLSELFRAERLATQYALLKSGRMSSTITLDRLTPYSLGKLFYFFEMETVFTGFLYGINPFDQPGVEEGKRATYDMMGRPGYEGKKDEVMAMMKNRKREYIIEDDGQ